MAAAAATLCWRVGSVACVVPGTPSLAIDSGSSSPREGMVALWRLGLAGDAEDALCWLVRAPRGEATADLRPRPETLLAARLPCAVPVRVSVSNVAAVVAAPVARPSSSSPRDGICFALARMSSSGISCRLSTSSRMGNDGNEAVLSVDAKLLLDCP